MSSFMATDALSDWTAGSPPSHSRVARQGIYDRVGRLVAHELLFRGLSGSTSGLTDPRRLGELGILSHTSEHDRATSQVIAATFGDFGIDELGGGRRLFLNMTRHFLTGELPLPFGSDGVVLEVLEHITVDDELLAGLDALKRQGFRLAADDFTGEPERRALLDVVDVVKVDTLACQDLAAVVELIRVQGCDAELLAERVETEDMLGRCMDLGFDLFQGYVFQRPTVLETARLSPSQITCLRLLRLLVDPDGSVDDIESLVSTDPGLSIRVLKTANSASSGAVRSVTSLRQAVVMLGPRALSAWVMLTLMGGLSAGSRDDLVTVLARAGTCELVAKESRSVDPDTAYTAGLLSGVAQVLRAGVGQVAHGAGMDHELTTALVEGTGPLGELVRAVEAHELDQADAAARCGVSPFALSRAYLQAWADALGNVSKLLGD
jgi:EAL and modified HD-GYP domain-containing signal transduction protein